MSNGARHGLGALAGVVVTPIIAVCMMYGTHEVGMSIRSFLYEGNGRWIGGGVLLIAAVLLGLVAGSRMSPLASLIPGAVYTAIGVLWIVAPRWTFQNIGRDLFPRQLWIGYTMLAPYGIYLLIGLALVVASLAPSRWKAPAPGAAAPRFGAPPAPAGPPPMHGTPGPMGAPQPPPWQAPGQPGQPGMPYGWPAPPYGPPPAQPGPANPPPMPPVPPVPAAPSAPAAPAQAGAPAQPGSPAQAEPSAQEGTPAGGGPEQSDRDGPDDDKPGDWTQMYGGKR